MFIFDLQLFGGGGENNQQKSSDQYYQQEANQSNQLFQQYMTQFLPIAQQMIPLLTNTVNGQNTSLTQAAMAPVNAATARGLNTMQNNIGGMINPDAAMADIALNGQQNAGLAADNLVGNSLTSLLNLFGMGQNGAGMGMNGLNSAGGGEANLGAQINQQQNQFWDSLLGGLGTGAGLAVSHGGGSKTAPSSSGVYANPTSAFNMNTSGWTNPAFNNPFAALTPGTSVTQSGSSTPISSNGPHSGLPGFGP